MTRLFDSPHRAITPPDLREGGHLGDAVHTTRAAIGGFNLMLDAYLRNGDSPCETDVYGIHTLLETQVMILTGIEDKVQEMLEENVQMKAALADQPSRSQEGLLPDVIRLREEIVAEKTKAGASVGAIAAALNMQNTAIERIIRQLQGADSPVAKAKLERAARA